MLLMEELDQAKTALAEVQALRLEMNELTRKDQEQGERDGGRVREMVSGCPCGKLVGG